MCERVFAEVQAETDEEVIDMFTQVNAAKKDLLHRCGHSPTEWVLGQSFKLPASLVDDPHAIAFHEEALADGPWRTTLAIRAAARRAFVDADHADAVRRALVGKSRPSRNNAAERRRGAHTQHWKGPATVIATERTHGVWITYMGYLLKVAPEMIRHATADEDRAWQSI